MDAAIFRLPNDPAAGAAWLDRAAPAARDAARALAGLGAEARDEALHRAAACLRAGAEHILAANARDVEAASGPAAFLDRLALTPARIEAMARGLDDIAALP